MDKLIDKAYKKYKRLSRYSSFPYYYDTNQNKYVYGTLSHLDPTTPYSLYTVKKNDTYDSISLSFYNTPTYFWVICDFNKINDPFNPPAEGTSLNIPVLSSIEFQ